MELDAISQPELEQIERIGGADIVIGILDRDHQVDDCAAVSIAREALVELSKPFRAVVVCSNGAGSVTESATENGGGGAVVFTCSLRPPGPAETPQQAVSNAYRNVFAVASKLGARACGVIASQPPPAAGQWIYRLIQPVLDLGFDLVAPCYARQKMEGLLNRSILAPLHRALYGEQLQNPMGPDFGLSGKLLKQILGSSTGRRNGKDHSSLASIASASASGGFHACESYLGIRAQSPTDWANLSSLLVDVLGVTFLEMEGRATFWQSVRGSKSPPRFGLPETLAADTGPLDVHGTLESFQLGAQNLQDIWSLILPPTTLMELRRLARLPEAQFRMQDQLWVRIVYDFALGHRLRTISRDHLLRSMTPLYLGWIASYALEMQTAGLAEVDSRLERLSKAYEDNKSYLVSRWRWPDHFNP